MIFKIKLITLALFLTGCASTSERAKEVPVPTLKSTFLYELEKGSDRSYLFGTVHLGVGIRELPPSVLAALNSSRLFIGEFDFRNSEALSQFDGRRHAKKLHQILSERELASLMGLLEQKFPKADPSLLAAFVEFSTATDVYPLTQIDASISAASTESLQSLDIQLLDYAIKNGKTLSFLDSPRLAGEALRCMRYTDDEYLKRLRQTISGKAAEDSSSAVKGRAIELVQSTTEAYRLGSEERIRSAGRLLSKEQHACMIKDRNEEWMSAIQRSISTYSTVFIAVGVLHIENDRDSLLQLLREAGFKVRRIE